MYIIILLLFYKSYVIMTLLFVGGIGAVGSAPHWQCGGQEFEPPMLHQTKKPALYCPLKSGHGNKGAF